MFDVIFDGIASVMAWFYSLVNDYTFAIAMLTLAIMLLFTPLTLRGARSMTKQQALQPEMAKLRKQFSGDRQKMNEEIMKMYQAHGVSPLGGCLPNLVQIPIFFVLYRVIWNLRIPSPNPPNPGDDPYPRNLSPDSDLYKDLVDAGGEMRSLGMDLAKSAREVVQADFVEGLPYLALVAVTFLLAFLQQRQMARRRGTATMPNRQMEIMMKYLPFMLPVFSFFVAAALVPYFIVSSIYRMLTQAFIHATMKPPQSIAAAESGGDVIEADTAPEPDPEPKRSVPNQRSRKALDAEAERRAERAERRAERRGDEGPAQPDSDGAPEAPEAPVIRRTRAQPPAAAEPPKRGRRGGSSAGRNSSEGRGRRGASASDRNSSDGPWSAARSISPRTGAQAHPEPSHLGRRANPQPSQAMSDLPAIPGS